MRGKGGGRVGGRASRWKGKKGYSMFIFNSLFSVLIFFSPLFSVSSIHFSSPALHSCPFIFCFHPPIHLYHPLSLPLFLFSSFYPFLVLFSPPLSLTFPLVPNSISSFLPISLSLFSPYSSFFPYISSSLLIYISSFSYLLFPFFFLFPQLYPFLFPFSILTYSFAFFPPLPLFPSCLPLSFHISSCLLLLLLHFSLWLCFLSRAVGSVSLLLHR